MEKYDLLKDIVNYENWRKIVQIDKGWSHDKKFYIEDELENKFLLRLSDSKMYEKKKEDFHILSKLYDSGIPMGRPIDFGYCGKGEYSYLLFSWVEGADAIDQICKLSDEEQYKLGYESGVILKKFHSIKAPSETEDWESRYNRKLVIGLNNYKKCGITIDNEVKVIKFITENRYLLKNRQSTFQHGDYHLGNFIITDKKELKIIDFNRCDYGDSWEEFNRLIFTSAVSIPFANGSIHGYFDNNVPQEFFKLLALYCARDVLVSVPWSIPYGDKDIKVALENGKKTIESYRGFETVIPSWYLTPNNMKINDIYQLIHNELSNSHEDIKAAQISKIANKYYKLLPEGDQGFLELCENFFKKDDLRYFSIATLWFKKSKTIIKRNNFQVIERWLLTYINSWGECDQFCYRILNPFIERFPELYSYIEKWSQNEKTYIRRASVVCMLYSSQSFKVNYPIEKVMPIVNRLINDKELHVQKGVGWLLKYAYLSYSEEVVSYLKENVHIIPRVVYRYALEKMPSHLKSTLIKIPYK